MERRRLVESGDNEQRKHKRETKEGDPKKMMTAAWHKVAAVSGVAALGLGTYGSHLFRPKNPAYKEVWHTASLYHLVHTAALLGAPIAYVVCIMLKIIWVLLSVAMVDLLPLQLSAYNLAHWSLTKVNTGPSSYSMLVITIF